MLAVAGVGMTAANAAPAVSMPLDPAELFLAAVPVENLGVPDLTQEPAGDFAPVPAEQGGSVSLDLPAHVDGTGRGWSCWSWPPTWTPRRQGLRHRRPVRPWWSCPTPRATA